MFYEPFHLGPLRIAPYGIMVALGLMRPEAPVVFRLLASRAWSAAGDLERAEQILRAVGPPTDDAEPAATMRAFVDWLLASVRTRPDAELAPAAASLYQSIGLAVVPQLELLDAIRSLTETHPDTAHALLATALAVARPEERSGAPFTAAGRLALRRGELARADELWTAAIAFEDGHAAAEDLARLLLVLDRPARAAAVYGMVTQPTDPALAARFGRLDWATGVSAVAIQREPGDLLAHATLGVFGEAPLLDWPATEDPELRQARLDLIACLRDPDLAPHVGPLTAVLQVSPNSLATRLLRARVLAEVGDMQKASRLHALVERANYNNPIIWHEVAYAGLSRRPGAPDYVADRALWGKVIDAVTSGQTAPNHRATAWGLQEVVLGFVRGGFPDLAKKAALQQWLSGPSVRAWTEADLVLITTELEPRQACFALDRILRGSFPGERDEVLRRFYDLAEPLALADATAHDYLTETAARHANDEGPHGRVVHFLLQPLLRPLADRRGVDAEQLLVGHLERIATGKEDSALLDDTMDKLMRAVGIEASAAHVDTLLDRYPTSVPLWAERTRLRARLGYTEALEELRNVLAHARDPRAVLSFVGLAAAERRLTPADSRKLEALSTELLESDEGSYVRGLITLRSGDAAAAIPLLDAGAAQYDGRHDIALALAHLQSGAADGIERAIGRLEAMLADYPTSSLARNVGSFVRQLSPRSDSAVESVSNR